MAEILDRESWRCVRAECESPHLESPSSYHAWFWRYFIRYSVVQNVHPEIPSIFQLTGAERAYERGSENDGVNYNIRHIPLELRSTIGLKSTSRFSKHVDSSGRESSGNAYLDAERNREVASLITGAARGQGRGEGRPML